MVEKHAEKSGCNNCSVKRFKIPDREAVGFLFVHGIIVYSYSAKAEPGIGTFSCLIGCQRVIEPVLSPLLYKPALK